MNKKITTIDDLAVMIGKESQAAEKRFGILENKIEKMAVDIKEIRTDVGGIHKEINGMYKEMGGIHADIKEIRMDIKSVDTRSAVIGLELRVSKNV